MDSEPKAQGESQDDALDRAVGALRADVFVRPEWRESLLQHVAELPAPGRGANRFFMPRRITVYPLAAVAACLVAIAAGAGGMKALAFIHRTDLPQTAPMAAASVTTPTNGAAAARNTIRFALVAPGATHVSIVGDFNGWDATATPMQPVRDGRTWLVDMPLSAGRHVYAFVVDGDLVSDPAAARVVDDDFGMQNSVVVVAGASP